MTRLEKRTATFKICCCKSGGWLWTDAQGRRADFSNTIILLTSNLGARCLSGQTAPLGFGTAQTERSRRSKQAIQEAKDYFRLELMGRLDEVVVLIHSGPEQLVGIADRLLRELEVRAAGQGYLHFITASAAKVLGRGHRGRPTVPANCAARSAALSSRPLADCGHRRHRPLGTLYTADADADGHSSS